jgi:hypothetical protein
MTDDPRDILFDFARRVVDAVIGRLGTETIESIFVSGGAARNEIASFRTAAGIEIYSDLDVFVMLREGADLGSARRAARCAASTLAREGRGFRIFPLADVGVFTESDFLSQKSRPGTVEIRESHTVLYGNMEMLLKAIGFVSTAIDADEGLYLIENRLSEIGIVRSEAREHSSEAYRRYLRYVLLKSCTDAATAVLIVTGQFHPVRGERWRRFRGARARGDLDGLLPTGSAELIDSSFDQLSRLQTVFESSREEGGALGRSEEEMLLGVWERIARRIAPRDPGNWAGLVDWRCKAGRWAANARELSALARRASISRMRLFLGSARLARLSPVASLRLWGLVTAFLEGEGISNAGRPRDLIELRFVPHLDRLTKAFRYTSGGVLDRARRMFEETS